MSLGGKAYLGSKTAIGSLAAHGTSGQVARKLLNLRETCGGAAGSDSHSG